MRAYTIQENYLERILCPWTGNKARKKQRRDRKIAKRQKRRIDKRQELLDVCQRDTVQK